jgi:hypothetical protein
LFPREKQAHGLTLTQVSGCDVGIAPIYPEGAHQPEETGHPQALPAHHGELHVGLAASISSNEPSSETNTKYFITNPFTGLSSLLVHLP